MRPPCESPLSSRHAFTHALYHDKPAASTNDSSTFRPVALSADLPNMAEPVNMVLQALWAVFYVFFKVAFFWQRVRLIFHARPSSQMLIC
jgi:hypothetical protein